MFFITLVNVHICMYILSNGKQQISTSIWVDGARFGLAGCEKGVGEG